MSENQTSLRFVGAVLISLILGGVTGLVFGPKAAPLGELGGLVIKLLKSLATPLVFFAVAEGFSTLELKFKKGAKLLTLCALNAVVATTIALTLSHLFPVAGSLHLNLLEPSEKPIDNSQIQNLEFSILGFLKTLVPVHIFEPFVQNNVIAVVFLAAAIGSAMRVLRRDSENVSSIKVLDQFLNGGMAVFTQILKWVILLVPLAVFGVVAKVMGQSGFRVFEALGMFVVLVAGGLFLQGVVYYSSLLFLGARVSPRWFFSHGRDALMTAFGTGSSLATLPVTLRTLEHKMGVKPENARLAACVGTNFNNDGIILYEAAAAMLVAQLVGVSMTQSQQIGIAVASTFAAMGIAGIPEAGLITLSLVLSTVGLPVTLVPLLLPVDWLIGRLRAMTNVSADMTNAMLLERGLFRWRKP